MYSNSALSLQIASRYAFGRTRSLSAIGRLATAGLALSVAVLVIVISVVNGFERELRERILALLPHVTVQARSPQTPDSELQRALAALPGVERVTPFVEGAALLATADKVRAVTLSGIDLQDPPTVARISRYVAAGGLETLAQSAFSVLLGAVVARDLGVGRGDAVTLVLPQASVSLAGLVPRQKRVRVAGIVDSKSELDSRTAYMAVADAQRLFRLGGRVHGYQLQLTDLFTANAVAGHIEFDMGGGRYLARSWLATHGNLYRAIAIQKQTMFILLSFLIAVAAFNLISSLLMVGKQRAGDVAILTTLGARRRTFAFAFALLGLMLGGLGILFGIVFGIVIAWSLPALYRLVTEQLGLAPMAEYFVNYLPVDVRLSDLFGIVLVALSLALISAIYPAWRISAMRPSEVLAHE